MSARRDWTEAEAKAWLKASLPKGWKFAFTRTVFLAGPPVKVLARHGAFFTVSSKPTLRAACLALVRAAKRAGVAVATVEEP